MTTDSTPAKRHDISGREDLKLLVDEFYQRVGADDKLGFIFNDIAAVDWQHHLPRMVDFWEKALFRTGDFRGNPLAKHLALSEKTALGKPQFDRWLELFNATADQLFVGERTGHLKRIAADIAQVMTSRITGEPIPFSTPRPQRVRIEVDPEHS